MHSLGATQKHSPLPTERDFSNVAHLAYGLELGCAGSSRMTGLLPLSKRKHLLEHYIRLPLISSPQPTAAPILAASSQSSQDQLKSLFCGFPQWRPAITAWNALCSLLCYLEQQLLALHVIRVDPAGGAYQRQALFSALYLPSVGNLVAIRSKIKVHFLPATSQRVSVDYQRPAVLTFHLANSALQNSKTPSQNVLVPNSDGYTVFTLRSKCCLQWPMSSSFKEPRVCCCGPAAQTTKKGGSKQTAYASKLRCSVGPSIGDPFEPVVHLFILNFRLRVTEGTLGRDYGYFGVSRGLSWLQLTVNSFNQSMQSLHSI